MVDQSQDILFPKNFDQLYEIILYNSETKSDKTIFLNWNYIRLFLTGYDSKGGATDNTLNITQQDMSDKQCFVWNDKFSFNGYEPVNFGTSGITAAPLSAADQQDAIADQGSSVSQSLKMATEHADDNFDVHVTFIDQNNA